MMKIKISCLPMFLSAVSSFALTFDGIIQTTDTHLPVYHANILLRHTATEMGGGAVSDENGKFRIENLSAGNYVLTIQHQTFFKEIYVDTLMINPSGRAIYRDTLFVQAPFYIKQQIADENRKWRYAEYTDDSIYVKFTLEYGDIDEPVFAHAEIQNRTRTLLSFPAASYNDFSIGGSKGQRVLPEVVVLRNPPLTERESVVWLYPDQTERIKTNLSDQRLNFTGLNQMGQYLVTFTYRSKGTNLNSWTGKVELEIPFSR